jgi:uridine kinase
MYSVVGDLRMVETNRIVSAILQRQKELSADRSLLVGISGVDASGKSTIASVLVEELKKRGLNAVSIGLDAWHNPPETRFNDENPAEHFYWHAFRFRELFEQVINPLRRNRSIRLTVDVTRLPQNDVVSRSYDFQQVDAILLEGIFLMKRLWRNQFDLAFWVECSFETALERAILRNQEGLSEEEIIRDYREIYFPAQRLHLAKDDPRSRVNSVIENDDRLPGRN